jgi:hypothetical protein
LTDHWISGSDSGVCLVSIHDCGYGDLSQLLGCIRQSCRNTGNPFQKESGDHGRFTGTRVLWPWKVFTEDRASRARLDPHTPPHSCAQSRKHCATTATIPCPPTSADQGILEGRPRYREGCLNFNRVVRSLPAPAARSFDSTASQKQRETWTARSRPITHIGLKSESAWWCRPPHRRWRSWPLITPARRSAQSTFTGKVRLLYSISASGKVR